MCHSLLHAFDKNISFSLDKQFCWRIELNSAEHINYTVFVLYKQSLLYDVWETNIIYLIYSINKVITEREKQKVKLYLEKKPKRSKHTQN